MAPEPAFHRYDEEKDGGKLAEELERSRTAISRLKVIVDRQKEPRNTEIKAYIDELDARIEKMRNARGESLAGEKKFKAIFDNAGLGIAIFHDNGHIQEYNAAFREMFGYSEAELIEKHFSSLTHPDDVKMSVEQFRRTVTGETDKFRMEKRYIRKDGTTFWGNTTVSAIREHGAFHYSLVVIEDIDERKRMEGKVKRNEKYLAGIFEGFQEGISILDKKMNIVKANHAMEEWYSHMLPLAGKKCYEAYQKRPCPCEDCPSLRAMKEKKMQMSVVPYTNAEGVAGWMELYSFPLFDDKGNVAGVIEHVRDITERRRAEEALRKALLEASRFREAIDHVSAYIYMKDLRSRYIYANKPTLELFGCSAEELAGSGDDRFFPPETVKRLREVDLRVFTGQQTNEEIDVADTGAGRRVYLEVKTPIYEDLERKTICGLLGISTDITGRKQAEEALNEAKAQAELYVDLMGHDINNMNQISLGFLELAHNIIEMNGKLSEDDVGLLERAMDSLKGSSQLIGNVRKLQREKMGRYESEVIDVGDTVEAVAGQFQDIPGRDIRVAVDVRDRCRVRANALLKDVFVNLVGNAMKHSRGDLTVNVRVDKVSDNGKNYCRVDVEDNGPGIPDGLKDTLFDRLNLSSTRAKGKGFGLCLIKMLVDDYHGRFWVEDRIKGDHAQGARFVVVLPVAEG